MNPTSRTFGLRVGLERRERIEDDSWFLRFERVSRGSSDVASIAGEIGKVRDDKFMVGEWAEREVPSFGMDRPSPSSL
jgi:hypothetical protein